MKLAIALAQFEVEPRDVEWNLSRMVSLARLAAQREAAIVCFPELCLTGYLLDRADYSDAVLDAVEEACGALSVLARATAATLVFGCPERAGGELHNATLLLDPAGGQQVYRKVHMDYKERSVFSPGASFVADGNLGIGIACCYDIAFPEAARILALKGARALLFPMAWEKRRAFVMEATAVARAIENVAYVVCVNQTGSTGGFEFHGRSAVIDPLGQVVCRLGEEEGLKVVKVDLEWVDRLRASPDGGTYPLFADRRPDAYDAIASGTEAQAPTTGRS